MLAEVSQLGYLLDSFGKPEFVLHTNILEYIGLNKTMNRYSCQHLLHNEVFYKDIYILYMYP